MTSFADELLAERNARQAGQDAWAQANAPRPRTTLADVPQKANLMQRYHLARTRSQMKKIQQRVSDAERQSIEVQERSFGQAVGEGWDRGGISEAIGKQWTRIGKLPEEERAAAEAELREIEESFYSVNANDPIETESWWKNAVIGAANSGRPMASALMREVIWTGIYAGATAALAASPFEGPAGEMLAGAATVRQGRKAIATAKALKTGAAARQFGTGAKVGGAVLRQGRRAAGFSSFYEMTKGQMISDARREAPNMSWEDIDKQVTPLAALHSAIEQFLSPAELLTFGIGDDLVGMAAKKLLARHMANAVARHRIKWGQLIANQAWRWMAEAAEEAPQGGLEAYNIILAKAQQKYAEDLKNKIEAGVEQSAEQSEAGKKLAIAWSAARDNIREIIEASIEGWKESLGPTLILSLLGLPSSLYQTRTGVSGLKAQEARTSESLKKATEAGVKEPGLTDMTPEDLRVQAALKADGSEEQYKALLAEQEKRAEQITGETKRRQAAEASKASATKRATAETTLTNNVLGEANRLLEEQDRALAQLSERMQAASGNAALQGKIRELTETAKASFKAAHADRLTELANAEMSRLMETGLYSKEDAQAIVASQLRLVWNNKTKTLRRPAPTEITENREKTEALLKDRIQAIDADLQAWKDERQAKAAAEKPPSRTKEQKQLSKKAKAYTEAKETLAGLDKAFGEDWMLTWDGKSDLASNKGGETKTWTAKQIAAALETSFAGTKDRRLLAEMGLVTLTDEEKNLLAEKDRLKVMLKGSATRLTTEGKTITGQAARDFLGIRLSKIDERLDELAKANPSSIKDAATGAEVLERVREAQEKRTQKGKKKEDAPPVAPPAEPSPEFQAKVDAFAAEMFSQTEADSAKAAPRQIKARLRRAFRSRIGDTSKPGVVLDKMFGARRLVVEMVRGLEGAIATTQMGPRDIHIRIDIDTAVASTAGHEIGHIGVAALDDSRLAILATYLGADVSASDLKSAEGRLRAEELVVRELSRFDTDTSLSGRAARAWAYLKALIADIARVFGITVGKNDPVTMIGRLQSGSASVEAMLGEEYMAGLRRQTNKDGSVSIAPQRSLKVRISDPELGDREALLRNLEWVGENDTRRRVLNMRDGRYGYVIGKGKESGDRAPVMPIIATTAVPGASDYSFREAALFINEESVWRDATKENIEIFARLSGENRGRQRDLVGMRSNIEKKQAVVKDEIEKLDEWYAKEEQTLRTGRGLQGKSQREMDRLNARIVSLNDRFNKSVDDFRRDAERRGDGKDVVRAGIALREGKLNEDIAAINKEREALIQDGLRLLKASYADMRNKVDARLASHNKPRYSMEERVESGTRFAEMFAPEGGEREARDVPFIHVSTIRNMANSVQEMDRQASGKRYRSLRQIVYLIRDADKRMAAAVEKLATLKAEAADQKDIQAVTKHVRAIEEDLRLLRNEYAEAFDWAAAEFERKFSPWNPNSPYAGSKNQFMRTLPYAYERISYQRDVMARQRTAINAVLSGSKDTLAQSVVLDMRQQLLDMVDNEDMRLLIGLHAHGYVNEAKARRSTLGLMPETMGKAVQGAIRQRISEVFAPINPEASDVGKTAPPTAEEIARKQKDQKFSGIMGIDNPADIRTARPLTRAEWRLLLKRQFAELKKSGMSDAAAIRAQLDDAYSTYNDLLNSFMLKMADPTSAKFWPGVEGAEARIKVIDRFLLLANRSKDDSRVFGVSDFDDATLAELLRDMERSPDPDIPGWSAINSQTDENGNIVERIERVGDETIKKAKATSDQWKKYREKLANVRNTNKQFLALLEQFHRNVDQAPVEAAIFREILARSKAKIAETEGSSPESFLISTREIDEVISDVVRNRSLLKNINRSIWGRLFKQQDGAFASFDAADRTLSDKDVAARENVEITDENSEAYRALVEAQAAAERGYEIEDMDASPEGNIASPDVESDIISDESVGADDLNYDDATAVPLSDPNVNPRVQMDTITARRHDGTERLLGTAVAKLVGTPMSEPHVVAVDRQNKAIAAVRDKAMSKLQAVVDSLDGFTGFNQRDVAERAAMLAEKRISREHRRAALLLGVQRMTPRKADITDAMAKKNYEAWQYNTALAASEETLVRMGERSLAEFEALTDEQKRVWRDAVAPEYVTIATRELTEELRTAVRDAVMAATRADDSAFSAIGDSRRSEIAALVARLREQLPEGLGDIIGQVGESEGARGFGRSGGVDIGSSRRTSTKDWLDSLAREIGIGRETVARSPELRPDDETMQRMGDWVARENAAETRRKQEIEDARRDREQKIRDLKSRNTVRQQTLSAPAGRVLDRAGAAAEVKARVEASGGTWLPQRTSGPVLGLARWGNVTAVVRHESLADSPGSIKRDSRAAYTIYINPQTGRADAVSHEMGHMVRDFATPRERAIVKQVLKYDLATKEGDEAFALKLQTPEGRAEIAGQLRTAKPYQQNAVIGFINRVIDFLNAVFGAKISRIGSAAEFDTLASGLEDLSLLGRLNNRSEAMDRGATDAQTSGTREQEAHHGTPYTIAPEPGFRHGRFRLDKIGTGEGAAAYGWGINFGEAEGTGRSYRDNLARSRGMQPEDASLYKLDIPDDVIPNLLDWDKPLSEQSDYVQSILRKMREAEPNLRVWRMFKATGGDLYRTLAEVDIETGEGGKQAASEFLARAGIPGDKYLDQGSRGYRVYQDGNTFNVYDGTEFMSSHATRAEAEAVGTRNYVIWDQPTLDRIVLLERNGERLDAIRDANDAARTTFSEGPARTSPAMQERGDTSNPDIRHQSAAEGAPVTQPVDFATEQLTLDSILKRPAATETKKADFSTASKIIKEDVAGVVSKMKAAKDTYWFGRTSSSIRGWSETPETNLSSLGDRVSKHYSQLVYEGDKRGGEVKRIAANIMESDAVQQVLKKFDRRGNRMDTPENMTDATGKKVIGFTKGARIYLAQVGRMAQLPQLVSLFDSGGWQAVESYIEAMPDKDEKKTMRRLVNTMFGVADKRGKQSSVGWLPDNLIEFSSRGNIWRFTARQILGMTEGLSADEREWIEKVADPLYTAMRDELFAEAERVKGKRPTRVANYVAQARDLTILPREARDVLNDEMRRKLKAMGTVAHDLTQQSEAMDRGYSTATLRLMSADEVLMQQVGDVARFVNYAGVVDEMKAALVSNEREVIYAIGKKRYDALMLQFDRMDGMIDRDRLPGTTMANKLTRRYAGVILKNPWVWAYQPASATSFAREFGWGNLAKALRMQATAEGREIISRLYADNPHLEMRFRHGGTGGIEASALDVTTQRFAAEYEQYSAASNKSRHLFRTAATALNRPMAWADRLALEAGLLSAYNKALADGLSKDDALQYASREGAKAIARTQINSSLGHMSLMRSSANPLMRVAAWMSGATSAAYNMLMRDMAALSRAATPDQRRVAVGHVAMSISAIAAQQLLVAAIKTLRDHMPKGDDDDDKEQESLIKQLIWQFADAMSGLAPAGNLYTKNMLLGVAKMLGDNERAKKYGFLSSSNQYESLMAIPNDILGSGSDLIRAHTDESLSPKRRMAKIAIAERKFQRAIQKTIDLYTGVPMSTAVGEVQRIKNVVDKMQDDR